MRLTALRTVIAIPCLALFGCASSADPGSEEAVGTSEEAVMSTNRLSMNRLSMNRLSMNSLSMSRITADGRTLATTDLLLDEDGRELLRYTIACALPEGKSLVGEVGATTYRFDGRIGLAPDWLRSPLPEKSQRWVTACLLAHVNGYGVEVAISLRGRHPALATDSAERRTYQQEEISFFGNVFQPLGTRDELGDMGSRMYSCGGAGLQLSCAGNEAAFGPERTCASRSDCSVDFLGPCRDPMDLKGSVCRDASFNSYGRCQVTASTPAGMPMTTRYDEVVTVFLQRPDFSAFYPLCRPLFP